MSALHYRGVNDICAVSCTREHADRLSARVGGRPLALERLQDALDQARNGQVAGYAMALRHLFGLRQ